MIPYTIQFANPSEDSRVDNIDTTHGCSEKDNLFENIIDYIINIMYEFCSEEYGHNFKITSYDDFCHEYWQQHVVIIEGWYYVFNVKYFENGWIEWDAQHHKDEIFASYKNKYNC
jgi:hypothetical protein